MANNYIESAKLQISELDEEIRLLKQELQRLEYIRSFKLKEHYKWKLFRFKRMKLKV